MFIFSNKNQKVLGCFSDHLNDVSGCFEKFSEFFGLLFSEDSPDRNALQSLKTAIDNYEDAADRELRHIVDLLSQSFLPATRSELISLVVSTDEVANQCQEIARQVYLEKMEIPKVLHADILEIISITKRQLDLMYGAVDKLLNEYNVIFKDRKILDDIRSEESMVDNIEHMLHERIFELDISLCEKVYYRTLICDMCQISDIIEDISDQIQVMLVERES
jgi:predicted phosphate transport protein (TIGR00153 family)